MLLRINPNKPNFEEIEQVVKCLRDGGVVIYPTDTVYGIGCDINKQRAVERAPLNPGDAAGEIGK